MRTIKMLLFPIFLDNLVFQTRKQNIFIVLHFKRRYYFEDDSLKAIMEICYCQLQTGRLRRLTLAIVHTLQ